MKLVSGKSLALLDLMDKGFSKYIFLYLGEILYKYLLNQNN